MMKAGEEERKGKRRWKWGLSHDMEAKFSLCTRHHNTSKDIITHHKTLQGITRHQTTSQGIKIHQPPALVGRLYALGMLIRRWW